MSGPKGGSYRVESAAERASRLLRDAKAQYARAETLWESAASRLAAVETLTGQRITVARSDRVPASADAAAYTRAAAELESVAAAASIRAVEAREGSARSAYETQMERMIRDIGSDPQLTTASQGSLPRSDDEHEPPAPKAPADRERVNARIQRRLTELGKIDHDHARVQELLADIAAAGSESRADMLIGELDYVILEAKKATARREAAAVTLAELIAMQTRIAELASPEADRLRHRIASMIGQRVEAVPADLAAAVEAAISQADAEADRLCVVASMRKALSNLGYVVGPEFSTGLLGEPSVAYARNGSSRYGVKIRLEPESARFTAQAVKSDAELCSREEDAAAEREFCRAIGEVVELAKGDGVEIAFDTRARPGEYAMQQVADPQLGRPAVGRSALGTAPKQKEVRR